jgi:hypothetical protein
MHDAVKHYPGEGYCIQCPECENYHLAPELLDFEEAIETAGVEMQPSTARQYESFGVLGQGGRWDMDTDEGLFVFTLADGRKSGAAFSQVGSWIQTTSSWMWGWAMPETHITPKTRRAPDLARALGKERDWPVLTSQLLMVGEREAWHLTRLSASLAGHALVYRAPVNEKATVYFAIDALKWLN